ncbi:alpha/beta fold hydrolase, partial [Streptomyces sp. NPDC059578]|uniref:alpha/beta fold hydrolase n=1 Tax=unclassified Streptomyces TaxID=2593676 RepID=UPI00365C73C8
PLDPQPLRDHLAAHLPAYMIPTAYIPLPTLPLNTGGKLDVRALPPPRQHGTPGRGTRTVTESVLCELFADVLGIDGAGVDDDFFDLGGHSLLVPRLIGRIRSVFGVALPIRRLFDRPTVAGLAAALEERGDEYGVGGLATLFPLRTGGTAAPVFCIHPASGTAWCYAGLPRHIGRDHPVYGLQDPGLLDADRRPRSIGEMAARYVEQIREVRPTGPYHLIGWSFGGLVAHEAAVRLQTLGEEVGLLCVLDGYPLERDPDAWKFEPVDSVGRTEQLRRLAGVSVDLDEDEARAVYDSMTNNVRLMRDFVPGVFTGDLTFVMATAERGENPPEPSDWRPFVTGAVREHHVPCAHLDMTRPDPLALIGAMVARWLRDAS